MEPGVSPAPAAPSSRRSLLDLSPPTRLVFAALFVGVQLGLVFTGPLRSDGVFGFQMFNESSRLEIQLFRRVRGRGSRTREVPVHQGTWRVRTSDGAVKTFSWNDRVKDRVVGVLNREVHAAYGLEAQLFHLQAALEDVAAHLDGDHATVALIAKVRASYNGRQTVERVLEARRP